MTTLEKKLASATGMLSKLRYYVDKPTITKVYHALFKSRIQYGILSLGSANTTLLQPLRVLQNRAIRHISRVSRFARMDFVYLNLRLLKLDDIFTFELGKFMHYHHRNKLPNSFSDYFKKFATTHH